MLLPLRNRRQASIWGLTKMSDLTAEQVAAYLAEQAAAEHVEDERIFNELMAWLAERDREIVAVVQVVNNGMGAVPIWGIRKSCKPNS